MLSDWHIGTGSGIPGSVDALLSKDNDGFPQIPAKTVVGIWRDAMETLTFGLDDGTSKVWQKWVDVIFGSQPNEVKKDKIKDLADKNELQPRPAIISVQPARINETLRKAIGENVQLKQALTFVKPNTKIEKKSGTAESETLRFTEMGRIGSVLDAGFTVDFENCDDKQEELIKALLVASAKLIERIGGNRRRGSGRCDAVVSELTTLNEAVEFLQNFDVEKLSSIPKVKEKSETEVAEKDDSSDWKRIEYSLTLQTPVAIVTNTLGNVSETLDFIPGTYLLPHITKHLTGISKYIASGDFQVLPATICVEGNRGLPVPKVIWYHKVDGGFDKKNTVYNKLKEDISVGEQKKNYREGYINSLDGTNNALPFYKTTDKILLMHNTVEDEYQRPTAEVGGVFSRQAIKAGQVLKGEIRLKQSIFDDLIKRDEKWLEKLKGDVRLGTSKKDDYGLAELNYKTAETIPFKYVQNEYLVVYLASDVLLRNPNLRQSNLICELKTELEKTLGKDVLKCCEKKSLIQVRRIESWHDGWGFPRPTLMAMSAGSVAVFEVIGEKIDETKLKNLELSGIGERRGEGYGQIKFNPRILTEKINDWKISTKVIEDEVARKLAEEVAKKLAEEKRNKAIAELKAKIKSGSDLEKFVQNIEKTAWREELARAVLKIAADKDKRREIFGFSVNDKKESTPPLSQIGSLRSVIGKLTKVETENDTSSVVSNWINHLKETSNRLKKWGENEEIAEKTLKTIKKLVQSETFIWTFIEAKNEKEEPLYFNNPNFINDLKPTLWAEAVKSLFDACARANKRGTEDK